jgi:2-oxoisovalerate dehydrogenase E2 component (dihydrolipoyl transacylase)
MVRCPGDKVVEDQPMVDVMTEKVTVAISSPVSGVVLAIHGEVGQSVPVGSGLVELEIEIEREDRGARTRHECG